jgi:hypothetical protein
MKSSILWDALRCRLGVRRGRPTSPAPRKRVEPPWMVAASLGRIAWPRGLGSAFQWKAT